MDSEEISAAAKGAPEAEFLFLDIAYKAKGTPDDAGSTCGKRRKIALEVVLWVILAGGFVLFSWEHISSANAARAAGTADGSLHALNPLAQILLGALVWTRMARTWMGEETAALRIHLCGRRIEVTPKWDKGVTYFFTDNIDRIVVTEPAFESRPPRMTLIEKSKRIHTIRRLSDTSRLGGFAEFCRDAQFGYEQRKDSRTKAALYIGISLALFFVLTVTLDPLRPVQTVMEVSCLGLVVLLLGLMSRERC
mgnify:CR=1 FL=1